MNYDGLSQTALKQIKDKGRNIQVITQGEDQVYDPVTDTFEPGTPTEDTVKAAFTNFSTKDIDGELILRSDKRVLIAAASLPVPPDTTSRIKDGAIEYSVINTEVVQPGDVALLYMVQVRR